MLPQTRGAYTLYIVVLRPLFVRHEKNISKIIEQFKSKADEIGAEAMEKAKQAANSENIMKGASMMNEMKENNMGDKPQKKQDAYVVPNQID